jgi:hypothetical protein
MGAPPVGAPTVRQSAATESTLCRTRIAYSPDGRYLAATANLSMVTGELHLIVADVALKKARTIHGIMSCSVAFSADSRLFITGGLGAPQLWNAETGERVELAR